MERARPFCTLKYVLPRQLEDYLTVLDWLMHSEATMPERARDLSWGGDDSDDWLLLVPVRDVPALEHIPRGSPVG